VIDHGHCGLLVPVKHADALRLAIALLLEQPQLAREFGLAARRKVVREFAVSLVNEHTVATYMRLLPQASAT
jgi:glycosyltransferase involved in cell wall biosynthesis